MDIISTQLSPVPIVLASGNSMLSLSFPNNNSTINTYVNDFPSSANLTATTTFIAPSSLVIASVTLSANVIPGLITIIPPDQQIKGHYNERRNCCQS